MRDIIPEELLNPDEIRRVDTIIKTIGGYLKNESKILCVGSGDGRLAMELAFLGHKVTGIEIDDDQFQDAIMYKSKANLTAWPIYYQMDATDISYGDNSFDMVVCSEVLEHLNDDDLFKVIKELKRVCKKDGHIIVSVPRDNTIKGGPKMPHIQSFCMDDLNMFFNTIGSFSIPCMEGDRGWIGVIAIPRPKVSVIIPSYNNGRFLKETIESVYNQKYFYDYELVIVEDGSTDNSLEVISNYPDVKLVIHPHNQGVAYAWQTGFDTAEGDYKMLLSADDKLCDDTLWKMYSAITYEPNIVMVYGSVMTLHDDTGVIDGPSKLGNPDYERLLQENYIGFAVLVDSALEDFRSPLDEKVLSVGLDEGGACDWGLWLKILDHCNRTKKKIVNLEDPLYVYRIHGKQETFNPNRKNTMPGFVKIVQERGKERSEG